jgi:hypothetical protein
LVACRDEASPKRGATTAAARPAGSAQALGSAASKGAAADELEDFDDTAVADGPDDDGSVDDGAESSADGGDSCAPPDPKLKPMQVLRFVFADSVKGRKPGTKLFIARPGQRVYGHLTIRNRSGRDRCLRFVFRVNGKKRTELIHKIGKSWSWRTWAYNTVHRDDGQGQLQLEVIDDQGVTLLDKRLPVVPGPPPGR